ncbi:MAG: site-specific integrase [Bacteroidales bacterium]|jgi:integrase|nr:site-specific integrase [Bacteroidales bacterium]
MRSTFKILFYLKKGSEKPNENLPLMCRLTVDGEIKQFGCKLDVPPTLWDIKAGRASGKSVEARKINSVVDRIRVDVNRRYQELMQSDGYVTAEKLKNAYLGIGIKQETLLKLFEQHNAEFLKKVGHSRAKGTYTRYHTVCKHIREFLPLTYHREDIPLKELNLTFINNFEYYLRKEKGCRTNTVWGYMIVLKHIISIARNTGLLPFNPFAGYINSPENVDRGYLSKEELQSLMDAPMKNKTYELVRDLFVFSVFTGLAYADVKNLTYDCLQTFFDGNLWIITHRQKTNTNSNIRLLEVPRRIIDKYRGMARDNRVFPVPSNGSCNKKLKKIGVQCGIKTRLTYHVARHTAATLIFLSQGVPIETVSRLLGHTNIKTTQIYAKITNQKISQDLETLSHKIGDMEKSICKAI